MSYEAIGSGEGNRRIMDHPESLEYAGSDSLIAEDDYHDHPSLQMYPVIAGYGFIVNHSITEIFEPKSCIEERGIPVQLVDVCLKKHQVKKQ